MARRGRGSPHKTEPDYRPGQLLDWTDSSHWDHTSARPCRYCGIPTHMRDSHRSPAHKVCAEEALARQAAEAADAYHQNGQTT
ncbi:hypothetical protein [Streptomyces sp. NPDC087317]|uniref:hypothetical protein n=1 Tax=Streptomyces sp. NPDC087317 TaxID=3365784 RepID=UPI003811CB8B